MLNTRPLIAGYILTGGLLGLACSGQGAQSPVITSQFSACGLTNVPIAYQITADNNPVSYSVPGLPPSLSLNTATGLITGIATASLSYNGTIIASNSAGVAQSPFSIDYEPWIVSAGPVVTSPLTIQATVGVPFNSQITTSGVGHNNIAYGLPPGLSVDLFSGVISGTPLKQGIYYVRLVMQPAAGNTCAGNAILVITVNAGSGPLPVITSALSVQAPAEVPFSYQASASNSPNSFTVAGLPLGLTFSSNGQISGNPAVPGTYNVLIGAYNANGWGGQTLTLTVNPAAIQTPVITSLLSATGIAGSGFQPYHITATGRVTTFATSTLPPGLSFDAALANIYGIPTTAGSFPVTLTATNSAGSTNRTLTISIAPTGTPPPVVTQPRPGGYTIGNATAGQGSDVDVPIYFTPSPDQNTSTIGFNAVFPTHVTMTNFTIGPAAADTGLSANINPTTGALLLVSFGQGLVGPGLLGTLRLHVDSGTPNATLSITLAGANMSYSIQGTNQYLPIPMPVVDGTITISGGPPTTSACDVNQDTVVNVVDVQLEVNQALNVSPCTVDINKDTLCNIIDVQRVVNVVLGGQCVSP